MDQDQLIAELQRMGCTRCSVASTYRGIRITAYMPTLHCRINNCFDTKPGMTVGEMLEMVARAFEGRRQELDTQKEVRKVRKVRNTKQGDSYYVTQPPGSTKLRLTIHFADAVSTLAALDLMEENGLLG